MVLTCTNIKVSQLQLYHVCHTVTRLTNASMASCDDKVVTTRNLDSTSCTKIECIYVNQLSVSLIQYIIIIHVTESHIVMQSVVLL